MESGLVDSRKARRAGSEPSEMQPEIAAVSRVQCHAEHRAARAQRQQLIKRAHRANGRRAPASPTTVPTSPLAQFGFQRIHTHAPHGLRQ